MRLLSRMIPLARIAALLTLASLTVLFISAGQLVQDSRGLNVHSVGAVAIHICSGLLAAALAVHTWRTRTEVLLTAVALTLFGLTFIQAGLGGRSTLALHIVVAFILSLLSAWAAFQTFKLPTTVVSPVENPNALTHEKESPR